MNSVNDQKLCQPKSVQNVRKQNRSINFTLDTHQNILLLSKLPKVL